MLQQFESNKRPAHKKIFLPLSDEEEVDNEPPVDSEMQSSSPEKEEPERLQESSPGLVANPQDKLERSKLLDDSLKVDDEKLAEIKQQDEEKEEQIKDIQEKEDDAMETADKADHEPKRMQEMALRENDIDFLNVINDGLSAKEFSDAIMKLKTTSQPTASSHEESESWKAISIVKTDENSYTLESKDGKFKISAKAAAHSSSSKPSTKKVNIKKSLAIMTQEDEKK